KRDWSSDVCSSDLGPGTASDRKTPWPGLVQQVTKGSKTSASIVISASNCAPSSVRSDFQYSMASSQSLPSGECGRPFKYSNVVSSGAIMPARAPASIDMLQMVMRASMDSASMALPRYSNTYP